MKKHLHIVAFDIPFPADYGGVIDIYYKILALKKLDIEIILHCFEYGRAHSIELQKICKKVYYYNRSKYKNPFIGNIPYIVSTRSNEELLNNLLKDQFPILFEGLHCTYFLNHKDLKNRIKLVRNHNIEHDYYKNLEQVETNFFKKYFFRNESDNLRKYESILKEANHVLAISNSDHHYLQKKYHHSVLVSAFHANEQVNIKLGKGEFVLYHGNLSVGENNHAAIYLVKEVFSKINIPVVIAGNKPSQELQEVCKNHKNIQLISHWSNQEVMNAISDAQINVLATFQATGIKLKLLNALFQGRFCVVNHLMVEKTGLEKACFVSNNPQQMIEDILKVWQMDFNKNEKENRVQILNTDLFSNEKNAQKIIALI